MQWHVKNVSQILDTAPFKVEAVQLEDVRKGRELEHPYHRLICPDWVNILPVTAEGQAVLVRQSRVGTMKNELEVPGGVIEEHEVRDPTMAAARELEEETGFTTNTILFLGAVNTNPAMLNNRIHMFVGLNAVPAAERKHFPDRGEDIKVELHHVTKLDQMVRFGEINHSLAALTILMARQYLAPLKEK